MNPSLDMRKLRPRELKRLAQSHTYCDNHHWNSILTPKHCLLNKITYVGETICECILLLCVRYLQVVIYFSWMHRGDFTENSERGFRGGHQLAQLATRLMQYWVELLWVLSYLTEKNN